MKTSFRRRTAFAVAIVLLTSQLPVATARSAARLETVATAGRAPRGLALPSPARITPPPLVRAPKRSEVPAVGFTHEGGGTRGPSVTANVHDSKHAPPDPHAQSTHRRSVTSAIVPVPRGRTVPAAPGRVGRRSSSMMGGSGCNATPSDVPVLNGTDPGTGINPWWRYEEGPIPGVGRYMVNVATQNLLVQVDDMNVHNAGIDLAFRRTYNSLSLHDASGTDGATPSEVGNGWTSTFDAHLSSNAAGGLTVSDIDGARYDYTADGQGRWLPPAGQHATLVTFDGGATYQWTKKFGSSYIFAGPSINHGNNAEGYNGRLLKISGRNANTYIALTYYWQCGDAASSENLAEIDASTQSGVTAKLYFANFGGHQLLSRLVWPDGVTTVTYSYDAAGNPGVVQKPGPNNSGTPSYQTYVLNSGCCLVITSPRFNANNADGGYIAAMWASPARTVAGIQGAGVMNFTPPDGTNVPLQANVAAGLVQYSWTGVHNYAPGINEFIDTDGHDSYYYFDGSNRITEAAEWTGSTWLGNWFAWDASNDLITDTDARFNVTNYAHDANGNTTAVGEPYTTTSQGSFKPTKLFDYDAYNNVVAYCDETETHAANADWSETLSSQSDSLCASQAGAVAHWRATYSYPSAEPYGQLESMTTPMGYTRRFAYATAHQAGNDFGLPTSVTGDSFVQADGSSITPTQTLWYDATGNLRCYSKGQGMSVLSYDALGRLTSASDADDSSANATSLCGKSSGQAGWNTQTTAAYFPDGSKQSSQTPAERAFGLSSTFTYDSDGNVLTETQHHGCVTSQSCPAGTTQKWYDGADRLVEVAQPHDARTLSNPAAAYDGDPWKTRYLYDVSQGNAVTMTGAAPFRAYGNLYKTQALLSDSGWTDVRGSAFDAADRERTKFSYSVGQSHQLETTLLQYDSDSTSLGLLAKKTNPSNESVAYAYDSHGRVANESYAGDAGTTPGETYVYDADGRKTSVTSSQFGTQQYVYDADGRLTTSVEPAGGALTSPAQVSYAYYANGLRSAVSVSSAGLTQANALTYVYRPDGLLRAQTVNAFVGGSWSRLYTDAGRLRSVSGADAQTHTYDASGQLATYTVSAGAVNYTHDPEGSVLTEYLPNVLLPGAGTPVPMTITNTLNVRGELIDSGSGGATDHRRTTTHSGCTASATIPGDLSQYDASQDNSLDPSFCDRVNGVSIVPNTSAQSTIFNGQSYPTGFRNTVTFDATGRMAQTVQTAYFFDPHGGSGAHRPGTAGSGSDDPSTVGSSTDALATTKQTTSVRTYDVENHLRSMQSTLTTTSTTTGSSPTTTTTVGPVYSIGWGPNDHPVRIPMAPTPLSTRYVTLHWDGDLILFVTDDAGNVVDFKVGLDGDITPRDSTFTGLTVYDRDAAGVIIQTSNAAGSTGLSPLDPSTVSGPGAGGTPGWQTPLVQAQYIRGDGFMTAGVQINGVRAYDPNLGVWTTPDAYEGEVHDPASQQRYMFNRGNAIAYSDPSGYTPLWEDIITVGRRLLRGESPFVSSTERLEKGLTTSSGSLTRLGARVMGTLREIPLSRGNFGIGSVGDVQQAKALGDIWVGDGARPLSNGLGKISADGRRVFRDPSIKSDRTMQANFEARDADGNVTANGHLEIRPGGPINVSPSYIRGGTAPQ